jgi:glycosyltransferase involved in cell wall biosynthesis
LLASDIAGAKEVAVDSQTALLFRKGDIADLTAKTLLAARDPELRARIGQEAHIRAQAWSTTEAVAAYADALRSVIQRAAVAGGTG